MSKIDRRLRDARSVELSNMFYTEDGTWIGSLTITSNAPFNVESFSIGIPGMTVFYDEEIPTTSTNV